MIVKRGKKNKNLYDKRTRGRERDQKPKTKATREKTRETKNLRIKPKNMMDTGCKKENDGRAHVYRER